MEGYLQVQLARNVRRIREERGLSQEQMANELGVHRTYYGGIERGERNLSLRALERLGNGLRVEPIELLSNSTSQRGEGGAT